MFKEKEIEKVVDKMGVESDVNSKKVYDSSVKSKVESMDKVQDKMGYPGYKRKYKKGSPSIDRVVENIL